MFGKVLTDEKLLEVEEADSGLSRAEIEEAKNGFMEWAASEYPVSRQWPENFVLSFLRCKKCKL